MLVMFPFTSLAWKHFPELKFVQLPWRWLLCLNAAFAMLFSLAWHRWIPRFFIYAVFLAMIGFVWHRVQQPWWDNASDVAEMLDDQQSGQGYEGTDEYVPAGTDGYDISKDAPLVTGDTTSVQVQIQRWNARSKQFTAEASRPSALYLRSFNYPAWSVEVNGNATPTQTRAVTGQMVIPIQAGINRVSITFTRTWDRSVGMLMSLLTAFVVAVVVWRQRHRNFRLRKAKA